MMFQDLGAAAAPSLELTILMPCLNEERTVAACVALGKEFLLSRSIAGEVLVADNGSTDRSIQLAKDAGARVIQVDAKGYGSALRAGIDAARGKYVVMGDADLSYDFSRLDAFVAALRDGHDLVMGNRFRGGIVHGAMPWHHRYIGNPVLSFVGRRLFGAEVRDFHCGLRGFRRDAILSLRLSSSGMEFASEMVIKASLGRLRITEVPTTLSPDGRDRAPHLRSFRDGWRHLRLLFLHCPRWLFLYPGFLLLAMGVVLQALLHFGPIMLGPVGIDVHSLLYASAASVIGMQFVLYGVLSQVVAWRLGLLPTLHPTIKRVLRVRCEYIGLAGAVAFLVGGLLASGVAAAWIAGGFGALDPRVVMRDAIPALTAMILGAEVTLASMFLSLAQLPGHRTPQVGETDVVP